MRFETEAGRFPGIVLRLGRKKFPVKIRKFDVSGRVGLEPDQRLHVQVTNISVERKNGSCSHDGFYSIGHKPLRPEVV